MKNLICFVLFFILLFVADVQAASHSHIMQKCSEEFKQNPAEYEVVYNYGELQFDNSKSAQELSAMITPPYAEMNKHKLNGLTQLMPYIYIENTTQRTIIENYACYYPHSVRIVIGYKPTVYLRNDIRPGSCRFNVTLRHEQTHLDIGHLSLKKFARHVKARLPQLVKDAGVRIRLYQHDPNGDKGRSMLNEAYKFQINVMFERFVKEMTEQQMLIDTPEVYKEETSLCPLDD